jgi:glycosyltransferase involved in cell wall biosynthesis
MMSDSSSNKRKLSIGLPVYNGEKFLRNKLENIFTQTFQDFELIISDNASTDATADICEEYALKDNRISYIRQEKNIGPYNNATFVLNKAHNEYFVFAMVDDLWKPTFLEKNIKVLDSDNRFVGSISNSISYGPNIKKSQIDLNKNFFRKQYVKILNHFRISGSFEASGSYEKKIRIYLKKFSSRTLFAIFRTDKLKKSLPYQVIPLVDFVILLNILKYGNIHVVDEELLHIYTGGFSSKGIIHTNRSLNISLIGSALPYLFFTIWFIKNLGYIFFIRNIDVFLEINFIVGPHALINEIIKFFKKNMHIKQ